MTLTRKSRENSKGKSMVWKVKVCPECGGTGYDPLDGGQRDRCDGEGEIEVEEDD